MCLPHVITINFKWIISSSHEFVYQSPEISSSPKKNISGVNSNSSSSSQNSSRSHSNTNIIDYSTILVLGNNNSEQIYSIFLFSTNMGRCFQPILSDAVVCPHLLFRWCLEDIINTLKIIYSSLSNHVIG